MAAAAVLLLGTFGIARLLFFPPASPTPTIVLAQPVVDALVATHDGCSAAPDHHYLRDLPAKDDFPAIAHRLNDRIKQPVLATSLGEAWTFRGAAVCPVGKTSSAHLLFSQNGKRVSLFSLPASECKSGHGDVECQSNGHCIAGFARADGFYCIVGSSPDGSLRPAEIRAMRDQMRNQVTVPTPAVANSFIQTNQSRPDIELSYNLEP